MHISKLLTILLAVLPGSLALARDARPPQSGPNQAVAPTSPASPITGKERLEWFALSTVGPQSLAAGVLSAGWGMALNNPEEYPLTWRGFGKRYGMRLTGISTGNAIDASLGAIWGEDPRYFRASDKLFVERLRHVVNSTFTAFRRDGSVKPAYARIAGNVGNNFLANTWRPPSESSWKDALGRIAFGFLGRMSSNAFAEFFPDLRRRLFGGKKGAAGGAGASGKRK
ncbi:MAG: hypothetical protein ACRD7E_02985 [Bryobacteraceae bacterium]